jgi:hypothetical protein
MRPGGEFIIHLPGGVEHVVPNQFTVTGAQQLLKAAFWRQELVWYVGLCNKNPADAIPVTSMFEPTDGVNGYERQSLALSPGNWPEIGVINGESYVESKRFLFTATGAYDQQVSRFFLTDGDYVIAVSSQIEGGLQTISEDLEATYRLYLR